MTDSVPPLPTERVAETRWARIAWHVSRLLVVVLMMQPVTHWLRVAHDAGLMPTPWKWASTIWTCVAMFGLFDTLARVSVPPRNEDRP
jgi:hypothetical protein